MDKTQQLHSNASQQNQHILSAAEGGIPSIHSRLSSAKSNGQDGAVGVNGGGGGGGGLERECRECRVSLEERDLWNKFQELTNEMIVTKNGRFVPPFKC